MNNSIWFIKYQAIGLKCRRSLHELHCKNRLKMVWGIEDWCDCGGVKWVKTK